MRIKRAVARWVWLPAYPEAMEATRQYDRSPRGMVTRAVRAAISRKEALALGDRKGGSAAPGGGQLYGVRIGIPPGLTCSCMALVCGYRQEPYQVGFSVIQCALAHRKRHFGALEYVPHITYYGYIT